MPSRPLRRKSGSLPPAFSLVEVVIALGVVSFVLLSMLGLLSTGLQSHRESAEDTNLAFCAETAISLLRSGGFSRAASETAYQETNATPDFYFDAAGQVQVDSDGKPVKFQNPESHYACTVTRATPTLDQPTANLLYLRLKFSWPLAAPSTARQQRVVITSLAKYD